MLSNTAPDNSYRMLAGKPKVTIPLEKTNRRREDNIKMDLKRLKCEDVEWIYLTQNRVLYRALANTVMNLRVP
jgi:hypothetical protein